MVGVAEARQGGEDGMLVRRRLEKLWRAHDAIAESVSQRTAATLPATVRAENTARDAQQPRKRLRRDLLEATPRDDEDLCGEVVDDRRAPPPNDVRLYRRRMSLVDQLEARLPLHTLVMAGNQRSVTPAPQRRGALRLGVYCVEIVGGLAVRVRRFGIALAISVISALSLTGCGGHTSGCKPPYCPSELRGRGPTPP